MKEKENKYNCSYSGQFLSPQSKLRFSFNLKPSAQTDQACSGDSCRGRWVVQAIQRMVFLILFPTAQRAVLVVNKRNVTRKFKTYTQLWQILIQAKMRPIKESGQILSPIASCKNASLRFSFYNQPLWHHLSRALLTNKNMTQKTGVMQQQFSLSLTLE